MALLAKQEKFHGVYLPKKSSRSFLQNGRYQDPESSTISEISNVCRVANDMRQSSMAGSIIEEGKSLKIGDYGIFEQEDKNRKGLLTPLI